jgi:signal transduction histidine kinase
VLVGDSSASAELAIDLRMPKKGNSLALDAGALEAVVTTIVENARQAGASRLDIGLSYHDDEVWIDLADDGPGVPPADRDRIFDPFFTSKREAGGTGLGLPIARSLLHAYRGALLLLPSGPGAHFRMVCPTA